MLGLIVEGISILTPWLSSIFAKPTVPRMEHHPLPDPTE